MYSVSNPSLSPLSQGRVSDPDLLAAHRRHGDAAGADGARGVGAEEASAHQDLPAPDLGRPHLPQPLLRLQEPEEEEGVGQVGGETLNVERGRNVKKSMKDVQSVDR